MMRFLPVLLSLYLFSLSSSDLCGQQDSTVIKLDNMIETLISQRSFNGAILYAQGDEVLYEKYHGTIHPSENTPIDEHSSFNLASVSKQFFGMALLMLYEDSKIDLDAPLSRYLEDFPDDRLTVRQLVTQTSGLKEYFGEVMSSYSTNHLVENEDVYETMLQLDTLFNFEPGSAYQYSNTNYIFLAILIEKMAGIPIEEFIEQRIFLPLDMDDSFAYHLKRSNSPANRIYGSEHQYDSNYLNDLTPLDGVIGDGNLYATPRDLMKWVRGLVNHRLVSESTQQIAWTPQILNNDSLSYYGIWLGNKQEYRPLRAYRRMGRLPDDHQV